MSGMEAIILCGGQATRMGALCAMTPKVLLPIDQRPLLQIDMEHLAEAGCLRVTLAVGYLADVVDQWVKAWRGRPTDVVISRETEPLGTGGAVREAARGITRWPCLVLNGDVLANVNVSRLRQIHVDKGAAATITTVRMPDASEYGLLDVRPDGGVQRFREKQPNAGAGLINAGWYILEREAVDMVPASGFSMLERDVFPPLAQARRLYSYVHDGYWHDIGTPQRYEAARREGVG